MAIVYCVSCGFKNEAIVKPRFCCDCGQSLEAKSAAVFAPAGRPSFDDAPPARIDRSAFDGEVAVERDDGSVNVVRGSQGERSNGKQANKVRFGTVKEFRDFGVEVGRPTDSTDPKDIRARVRNEMIAPLVQEGQANVARAQASAPPPAPKRGRGKKA